MGSDFFGRVYNLNHSVPPAVDDQNAKPTAFALIRCSFLYQTGGLHHYHHLEEFFSGRRGLPFVVHV